MIRIAAPHSTIAFDAVDKEFPCGKVHRYVLTSHILSASFRRCNGKYRGTPPCIHTTYRCHYR